MRRVFAPDSGQLSRLRLDALTDVDAGRVAVLVRPGLRRRSWLTGDLLVALGAHQDASDVGKDEDRDWLLAHVWLVTHQVRDLLVVHAEWLPAEVLTELLLLGHGTGTTVWLLTAPPRSDDQVAVLDAWSADELTWAAFRDRWEPVAPGLLRDRRTRPAGRSAAAAPPTGRGARVPALLPDDDFPTFRAACRAVLDDDQFAALDAVMAADVHSILGWAATTTVTSESVAERLRDRYDRCATVADLLVAARAAQVALFGLGWFMQVDLPRFAGTAAHAPRRAARTPALWRSLRVYRQPDRGAACALAGAGLALTDMTALRIADCASDGASVTVGDRTWTVEPAATVYLRAQLLLRTAQGGRGDAPLFTDDRGGPARDRRLAHLISTVRTETGLIVSSRLVARDRPNPGRWYTQWGVSVQPLTAGGQS